MKKSKTQNINGCNGGFVEKIMQCPGRDINISISL